MRLLFITVTHLFTVECNYTIEYNCYVIVGVFTRYISIAEYLETCQSF